MNSERRKDCPMRHPDNGNCLPAGGFCTAVNDIICDALHSAHIRGYVMASEKYTEVVRCKDCKHLEKDPGLRYDKRMCLMRGGEYGYCKDDDFCSYGERKD